ncbi:hypothetical protein KI387_017658 [Taxus chinensis]|uniref:non-specific serine/threonine protein kinase n=1 Tax=Taxus chinensis TaxID=29808 RepID=A0AA38GG57_TAXCH|nr:hypothetical protein KI387_017658 [Taxus chinensis]
MSVSIPTPRYVLHFSWKMEYILLILMCLFSFSTPWNNASDQQSLLALKPAITSDPENYLANWNTDVPFCNWTGVTCSPDLQRVVELSLTDMGLDGTISPVVGNLSALEKLNLEDNLLHGNIPVELSLLPRLWMLDLGDNSLTGTIPSSFGNLSALIEFDSSSNHLHGRIPPQVGMLAQLKRLYLYGNQLSGIIPSSLGNLSNLIQLDLRGNRLEGRIPARIGMLTKLQTLRLSANQLSGTIPVEICMLTELDALYLNKNQLSGTIPVEVGMLTQLDTLYLGHNQLSGTIPSTIGNLTALTDLRLSSNHFNNHIPSSIGNLLVLTYLVMSVNNITGPIRSEIGMLTQLKWLSLHTNQLSSIIPSSIGNLSALTILRLSQNNFTGHIPTEVHMLTQLRWINLLYNGLTGKIQDSLGNCSQLERLILNNNQLGGNVPIELGKFVFLERIILDSNRLVSGSSSSLNFLTDLTNCSNLEQVTMSHNNLTGTLPPSIGRLSSGLSVLQLGYNKIRGNIPKMITNLTNLTYLDLGYNLLSGHIPSGIRRLHKLERLNLGGNRLEGSLPAEIGGMRALGLLDVSWNKLSGRIPGSLARLPQLRRLFLHHNHFSGMITASLKRCVNLELVDFSHNDLVGNIPREFMASLVNLQFYLNLSWNKLQGHLPGEISQIVSAQTIDISGNKLDGMIPAALADCIALEHLNLSHNSIEGPIPDALGKLQNLESIDLSFNFLSGTIPASLRKIKVLRYLNVCFNNLTGRIPEGGFFPHSTVNALFMGNEGLCGPQKYFVPACPKQGQHKLSLLAKVMLSAVGIIVFILCSLILRILWRQKYSRVQFDPSNFMFRRLWHPKFTYKDLVTATNGFNETNLLGMGRFGSVYKGILRDCKVVAIKVLNLQNEEVQKSFKKECKILGSTRHRNLVRVISVCSNPDFKALILEFAVNGSLEKHLYPNSNEEDVCGFNLGECLNIATDVAHAMEYLHYDCPVQVVHCDLKPSNVLLDANMTALVSDFGISRLAGLTNSMDSLTTSFSLRGSIGYIAPEYGLGGNISIKGDVYSYGILLLEMVTKKRPTHVMFVEDLTLQKWVRSAFPQRVADVVDSRLLTNVNAEHKNYLVSFIHIGLLCTNESPQERPTMRDVRRALEVLKTTFIGGTTTPSYLTTTISDLVCHTNTSATAEGISDSQSSTY